MKKIIILLMLMASVSFGQVTLEQGVKNSGEIALDKTYDNISVIVSQLGSESRTDSLYLYAIYSNPYREVLLKVVDQETRAGYTVIECGTLPKTYNAYASGTNRFKVEYANTRTITGRKTYIEIKGSGSNITSSKDGIRYKDTLYTNKSYTFKYNYSFIVLTIKSDTTTNYYDSLKVYTKSSLGDSSWVAVQNLTPLGTSIRTDMGYAVNLGQTWTQYFILKPNINELIINWINTVKNSRKVIIIIEAVK